MTESELLQALQASGQAVFSVFSMLVTMITAYLVATYYFLNRATLSLRMLAFVILSISMAFLGGATALQQNIQRGLLAAWAKLPSPSVPLDTFRNPLPLKLPYGLSVLELGTALGWFTAASIYIALAYLTFLHDWKRS
jgi:hypothetical protein